MEEAITIKALQVGLLIWLRTNGDRNNVRIDRFYIGKTEDLESRKASHQEEGYTDTLEIAHGDAADIKEAEPILVDCIMRSKFAGMCKNKEANKKGNDEADKLYIAYHAHNVNTNEGVEEGTLRWPVSFKLIGKKGMEELSRYLIRSWEKDTLQEWFEEIARQKE